MKFLFSSLLFSSEIAQTQCEQCGKMVLASRLKVHLKIHRLVWYQRKGFAYGVYYLFYFTY